MGDKQLMKAAPEGLEQVRPEDIVLPRVRLVQPVSQMDVGRPGDFVNEVTQESYKTREIQIVRYYPGRMWWTEEGDVPACLSRDGETPDQSIDDPPSERCEDCSRAQWADGKRPECAQTYTFSVIDLETNMPCAIQLSRSSAYAARRVLTYAFLNQTALRTVKCTMSSKEMRQGKGVYYVFDFTAFEVTENDKANQIAAMGDI